MTNTLALIESTEVDTPANESFSLQFFDDAEYEFVGGGNAVNAF